MLRLITIALFSLASIAAAANIDGKWVSEMKAAGGKKGGAERTTQMTLNLKSEGNALKGSVSTGARKRGAMDIQDGKIEGDRFSFTTVQHTKKKGDTKIRWEGSVQGSELRGTRSREGAKRGQPFTAKRGQ